MHEHEARRLIAKGADPRKGGPAASAFFGLSRTTSAREAFTIGLVLGLAMMAALAGTGAWILDLRPAEEARTTVADRPTADAMTSASPASSDKAAPSRHVPADATTSIEAALASVPEAQRQGALTDLLRLVPLLHDTVSLTLLRTIQNLSEQQRTALAQSRWLANILAWTADLTPDQQEALLAANLKGVLADPDRLALLPLLPDLDPLAARALATFRSASSTQRQTLMVALRLIGQGDSSFDRLAAALYYAAPSVIRLLDRRLKACSLDNKQGCQ